MSMSHQETIKCPECGKDSEFTVWQSINTTLDPEMKSAVRNKSAFQFICPYCGHKANVDYGFLYHQMEDHIMIHYANSEENAQEIYKMLTEKDEANPMKDMLKDLITEKYLCRIVRSQNQLLEKLAIFDAQMDDRIVEICKCLIYAQFLEKHPDSRDVELLMFTNEDKKHIVQIMNNEGSFGFAEISDDLYQSVKTHSEKDLTDLREDDPIIDRKWALTFMSRNHS